MSAENQPKTVSWGREAGRAGRSWGQEGELELGHEVIGIAAISCISGFPYQQLKIMHGSIF